MRKKSKILLASLVICMFVLMAFSYGNADYSTYELYYRIYGNDLSMSVLLLNNGLFKLTCAVFNMIGLKYEHMLIFMTTIGFLNLFLTLRRFKVNSNFVFVLYFIYPFIIDITQIRNFVAMSFLLHGCSYLVLEEDRKKALRGFIPLYLVASLFHFTFFFYIILIIIRFVNKKNWKYFAPVLIILVLATMRISISRIAVITSVERTEEYFGQHISIATLLVIVLYYAFIVYWSSSISKRFENEIWISNIYKLNALLTITIPIIYFSFEFMRIYRNIMFLNYILAAYTLESDKRTIKSNRNHIVLTRNSLDRIEMFLFACFSFYLFIYHDYFKSVIEPVFELNKVFHF